MKVKIETYKIVCDCCGETFHDDNDFVCFSDDPDGSLVNSEAEASDWMAIGDKHYCPDCYTIDDDDHIATKDGHRYDYDTHKEIVESPEEKS